MILIIFSPRQLEQARQLEDQPEVLGLEHMPVGRLPEVVEHRTQELGPDLGMLTELQERNPAVEPAAAAQLLSAATVARNTERKNR